MFALCPLVQVAMLPDSPRLCVVHSLEDEGVRILAQLEDMDVNHPDALMKRKETEASLAQESAERPCKHPVEHSLHSAMVPYHRSFQVPRVDPRREDSQFPEDISLHQCQSHAAVYWGEHDQLKSPSTRIPIYRLGPASYLAPVVYQKTMAMQLLAHT